MYAFLIVWSEPQCVGRSMVRRGRDRWMRRGAGCRRSKETICNTQLKFDICIWLNEMWLDSLTSADCAVACVWLWYPHSDHQDPVPSNSLHIGRVSIIIISHETRMPQSLILITHQSLTEGRHLLSHATREERDASHERGHAMAAHSVPCGLSHRHGAHHAR